MMAIISYWAFSPEYSLFKKLKGGGGSKSISTFAYKGFFSTNLPDPKS
jgi:hypothetical protein